MAQMSDKARSLSFFLRSAIRFSNDEISSLTFQMKFQRLIYTRTVRWHSVTAHASFVPMLRCFYAGPSLFAFELKNKMNLEGIVVSLSF